MSQLTGIKINRNPTIDIMKFFLILAIYVGHYGTNSGLLFPFFSSYHVRVFFLLSGLWAIKKSRYTISHQVAKGFMNYIVPWGIWIGFNTFYNAILYSYDATRTLEAFVLYFKSVRGSAEVGGSWFVPCFFLVSIIYHILLKLTALFKIKNRCASTITVFFISFVVYYCSCYVYPLPQNLIFSIHCIPEYLFVYSLGSTLYNVYMYIYPKFTALSKYFISIFFVVIPVIYMMVAYFGYIERLWSWVYLRPANPLYLLPETVRTVMAFLFVRVLAKMFAFPIFANIGQSTLILCLSESVMKTTIWLIADIFGLSTNVTNPVQSLCFSIIVMVIAMHTAIPITNTLMQRINTSLSAFSIRCRKGEQIQQNPS